MDRGSHRQQRGGRLPAANRRERARTHPHAAEGVQHVKAVLELDDVKDGRRAGLQGLGQGHQHAPQALSRCVQDAAASKVDHMQRGARIAAHEQGAHAWQVQCLAGPRAVGLDRCWQEKVELQAEATTPAQDIAKLARPDTAHKAALPALPPPQRVPPPVGEPSIL